jgi:hypothetical protein
MTDKLTIPLREPVQAWQAIKSAWEWAKPRLIAGHRLVLALRLETRSDAQNRLLHSRIGDVAKHCAWQGMRLDTEDWKRLLTAAWCRTRNEGVRIVPALDGQGFDVLYERTSKLSRAECADLSEYIMAWGSEREVPWCPASLALDWPEPPKGKPATRERIDSDTGEILENA